MKAARHLLFAIFIALAFAVRADDWPQFRGLNRDAVWNETGLMQTFPPEGLKVAWHAQCGFGLSSPVIAQDRVYLNGSVLEKPKAEERVQCFDEKTGALLWSHSTGVNYPGWAFDPAQKGGPNATPTVNGGKVYSLGQTGDLLCLDAMNGAVIWQKNLMQEYAMKEFTGTTPSPLVVGDLLILVIGCQPDASVVALDKNTGRERWKALDDPFTYSSPIIINAGGQQQLIVWTPKAVTSLDPATGRTWWRKELNTSGDYGVATPVVEGDLLLISGLMFRLDATKPAASVLWPETKPMSKRVLSQTSMPLLKDGHVYAGKTNGQLVCLDAHTGKQVWETGKITGIKNGASLHLTPNGGSVLIFTDQGNLIRAELNPTGYRELSRVYLVDPTYPFAGRKLIWPPPAYANGHIFIHNGDELVCASLEKDAAR